MTSPDPQLAGASRPAEAPGESPPWSVGIRKVAAWIALAALAVMVAASVVLAFRSILDILAMVVALLVIAIGLWWSLVGHTIRRVIGMVLVAAGVIGLVVDFVLLAAQSPWAFTTLVVAGIVFGFFSARALKLGSRYRRWQENRVALASDAAEPPVDLHRVTVPSGLIVNEKSGGGKADDIDLAARAREMGIEVRVLGPDDDLVELAEDLVTGGAQILGMAGGDGSLGLVADVCRRHEIPFVCIPVGTRNHFARDLGLNRSYPLHALSAFDGRELTIDVAVASSGNGEARTFLNNATFGAYADMVAEPTYRDAKLETAQRLVSEVLSGDREPSPLQFANPEGKAFESAFLIMVAVGEYQLDSLADIGVRAALDDGALQVSVLEPSDEPELRRLTTAAVLGSLHNADGFWQWTAATLEVSSPIGLINLGIDGEALQWESPVTLRIEPRCLRVLVPERIEAVPGPQSKPLAVTVSDLWRVAIGAE